MKVDENFCCAASRHFIGGIQEEIIKLSTGIKASKGLNFRLGFGINSSSSFSVGVCVRLCFSNSSHAATYSFGEIYFHLEVISSFCCLCCFRL